MELFLFTENFPFGKKEAFLENEITVLAQKFDKVHLFPWKEMEGIREIPKNCVVHQLDFGNTSGVKKLVFSNLFLILEIVLLDLFSSENRKSLKRVKAYFDDLIRLLFEANQLELKLNSIGVKGERLFYTYWFANWTTVLSVIKSKSDRLITRTHGYDFNLERNKNGYFPFRPFAWKKLDRNFNVSRFGEAYLLKNYKQYKSKITRSYLGVTNQNNLADWDGKTILSCSNVIPLKRVHLIPEALKEMGNPIHWIHFGDGPEMETVKQACIVLPNHITVDFKGHVSNEEVLSWYKENPVSVFIHLSSSEGLPVSMMEAQSFGVPILACDVGGVSELVKEETGVLLPKEFTNREVVLGLKKLLKWDKGEREGIQEYQRKVFSAQKNYNAFIEEITK